MLEKKALERAKNFNDTINESITHTMGIVMANTTAGCRISGIPKEYRWVFDVANDTLNVFKAMCDYIEAEAEVIDSLVESNNNLERKLNDITSKQDKTINVLDNIRTDVKKITAKQ